MKLARKLSFALFLGVLTVLVGFAYVGLERQIAAFDDDVRQDHRRMGLIVRPSLAETWRQEGEGRLLGVVQLTDEQRPRIKLRWVWLDAPAASDREAHWLGAPVEPLRRGELVQVAGDMPRFGEGEFIVTYVPVVNSNGRVGVLEMAESVTEKKAAYLRATVLTTAGATLAIALVCGAVAMGIGRWFVGSPITQLIDKARRVGAGDFSGPLRLPKTDEIGELAHEFNAMCDRLAGALEQVRHSDRLSTIGKLTSVIAHEIGTPLNVIAGHARLIARGRVSGPSATESATIISEECSRMTNIVRQVLDYSRRRDPKKKWTNLADIVHSTVNFLDPLRDKAGVRITVEDAGHEAALAHVDGSQLQQALTNMIVNAIQASREGQIVTVSVDSVARASNGAAGSMKEYHRISVRDRGAGISEDVLQRVFEPFFTTKEAGQGTGLGLSIARDIVVEHGGSVEASSELGAGSRFDIYLPKWNIDETPGAGRR